MPWAASGRTRWIGRVRSANGASAYRSTDGTGGFTGAARRGRCDSGDRDGPCAFSSRRCHRAAGARTRSADLRACRCVERAEPRRRSTTRTIARSPSRRQWPRTICQITTLSWRLVKWFDNGMCGTAAPRAPEPGTKRRTPACSDLGPPTSTVSPLTRRSRTWCGLGTGAMTNAG